MIFNDDIDPINPDQKVQTMNKISQMNIRPRIALAAMLSLAGFLLMAVPASASTYNVRQCTPVGGHGAYPNLVFAPDSTTNPEYSRQASCNTAFKLNSVVPNSGATGPGRYANLFFRAPSGTYIDNVDMAVALQAADGFKPILMEKRRGQGQRTLYEGTLSYRRHVSSGDVDYVGVGMFCSRTPCTNNTGDSVNPYAALGDATFLMRDISAPSINALTGSATSGWVRGSGRTVGISGSDNGAGVERTTLQVNGSTVHSYDHCNPGASDGLPTSMAPCVASRSSTASLNTATSPFNEGINTVKGCVVEYGTNPASGCRTIQVKVDNVAPTAPTNLGIAQGSGWQRNNDFDLSWQNPNQSNAAPVDRATITVTGPTGTAVYHRDGNVTSANDIRVPARGEFTVKVHLRDAAGNENPAAVATQTIRFDNEAPEEATPEKANGWLNRQDIEAGYQQDWFAPQNPPISGIQGYAVAIDKSPSTDPCDIAGGGGAASQCSDAEVNFKGVDNRSTTLDGDDLSNGENHVHVASVSGSGVKTDEIRHTRLLVDTQDPATTLRGAPSGWVRNSVEVMAVATDGLSGMVDTDDYPDDPPPATFLSIDGTEASASGAEASGSVSGDGIHEITHRARDLAGNTSTDQSAQVKIDGTKPSASMEPNDRNDPELIAAKISDATSGIASAELQFREGNKGWVSIPTSLSGNRAAGRVDSRKMQEGETYLFRVVAADRAGNQVETSKLQNGVERKVTGPLRGGTTISELQINGKRKSARISYGKQAEISGKLIGEDGKGVGGATVAIIESFDAGAKKPQRTTEVRTGGDGVFTQALGKGPSRSVEAIYGGSKVLLDSQSAAAPRLNVRGKVKLKATNKRVKPGKTTIFKGRVAKGGAKIPGGGKLVEVQVRVGNKWKVLEKSQRTNGKGKFKLRYRFARFYTQRTQFQFRAVVLRDDTWPYLPAKSKRQRVTIVP